MVRILFAKLRRDILRQWAQFTAVAVIAMLGVALFGASNDAYLNLKASYSSMFTRLRFADLQVTGGDTSAFATAASIDPSVQSVQRRHVADVPFQVAGDHRLIGRLVGMPVDAQPSVDQVMILRGSYLNPANSSGVLAEQHFANHFNLQPGSHLQVLDSTGWRDLTVLGVVASAEFIWPARSRQDALTTPDDFGVLFAPDQLVTDVAGPAAADQVLVYLNPLNSNAAALDRLRQAAAQASATDVTDRATQPSNASLSEDINGFGEMAFLFPILFLGAAAMTVYVLLTRLVLSQRAIIGTLLACGVRRRLLLLHYVAFGVAVGLAGGLAGAALGLLLAGLVTHGYTAAISIPVTVIGFYPETPATGIAMATVVGALAALAPALAAFRVPPAEAMRGIAPIGRGSRTLLERVMPGIAGLPAGVLLVLRGVWRNRRRAVTTVIGVVLAATLILVSLSMLDSIQVIFGHQFQDVQRQDSTAYAPGGVDATLLSNVALVPGVAAAEQFAQLPVILRHGGQTYQTVLEAYQPRTQMHGFYVSAASSIQLPDSGVLLGSALAQKLGLQLGDSVDLQLTSLDNTVSAPVHGFVNEAVGSFAYTSIDWLKSQLAGSDPANAILLRYAPMADHGAVARSLDQVPGVALVVDTHSAINAFGQFLNLFYAIVGVMLAFGVAMAFGLIFAMVSVNVLERTQEFATLQTSGVRLRQLAGMVTAENMILTVTGLIPGLVVGFWAAGAFMATFNSDLFHFDAYLLPRSFVITIVAIVLAALASELPALRTIARIDLAAAVRERAA
jgi:putative ABC transport system permease protein